MTKNKDSNTPTNSPKAESEAVNRKRPPLYNVIFVVVTCACITGFTWLARSGALQMWGRHPRPAESYEFGWFVSLTFGVIGGFIAGSMIMWYFLNWYWGRCAKKQRDKNL